MSNNIAIFDQKMGVYEGIPGSEKIFKNIVNPSQTEVLGPLRN